MQTERQTSLARNIMHHSYRAPQSTVLPKYDSNIKSDMHKLCILPASHSLPKLLVSFQVFQDFLKIHNPSPLNQVTVWEYEKPVEMFTFIDYK
jgi:hypothetical protein